MENHNNYDGTIVGPAPNCQEIIVKVTKCADVAQFQSLDIKQRDKYLIMLKKNGLGIRQISRLTGASYYIVQKT